MSNSSRKKRILFLLTVIAVGLLAGCGKKPMHGCAVGGTVAVEGVPMAHGLVTFVPVGETPGPKATGVIRDGQFAIKAESGPHPGEHRIEINAMPPELIALESGAAMSDAAEASRQPYREVAAAFNALSQRRETIAKDQPNHFEFHVEWRREEAKPTGAGAEMP